MKATFNTWYIASIILAGVAFFTLALSVYFTGQTILLYVGMGVFLAVTMTMTSIMAQRQRKPSKGEIK
ncbi:hypothetical protein [Glutamicibacter sp.]|uniref:hypothetical protein n=1 Tax=Glutamicibacter sp. TaxID=1931995 RepID=UPI002FE25978